MFHFSRRFRVTMLSTMLIALGAHLFALTNVLKNHDNMVLTGYGAGTASGRWFLGWFGDLVHTVWGNYNIPFFNGLLSLLLLSLAAYIGILIFDIEDLRLCVLWGGLFLTFPSVTSLMFYMYTAFYYALAVCMVMTAVFLAVRIGNVWSAIGAVILLACSLGIYQAYFPLAVGLFVTVLIIRMLNGSYAFRRALGRAFLYLGILTASMGLYFVLLRLRLSMLHIVLNSYKGIDKMGQISLKELPAILWQTYKDILKLPTDGYYQMIATPILSVMLIVLAVLSLVLFVRLLCFGGRGELKKKLPVLVFLALYPAAINSITLMCYHSGIYTLMIYAGVLIWCMPLLLFSEYEKTLEQGRKGAPGGSPEAATGRTGRFRRWISLALCASLSIVIANYTWQSNGNYISMYYTDVETYNYLNSLVTQIRMTPGFTPKLEWALIGNGFKDPLFQNGWKDTPFWYGGNKKNLLNFDYTRQYMFEQILGYEITWADSEKVNALAKTKEVKEMPAYPSYDSICVIEDTVVVKLK